MITPFDLWILAAVAIVSVMIGFWTGRSVRWGREEQDENSMIAFAGAEAARDGECETVRERFGRKVDEFKGGAAGAFAGGNTAVGERSAAAENGWNTGGDGPYRKAGDNHGTSKYRRSGRKSFSGEAEESRGAGREPWRSRDVSDQEEARQGEEASVRRTADNGREIFNREIAWKEIGMESKRIPIGWAIGSPVAGEVSFFYEGARRGAMICPEQGRVAAPAAGKIVRLYPEDNAFRLRTDFGVELLVQAGLDTGELEGMYYRWRVVQNEIVSKGKLLLEFDLERIVKEGYDPSVVMSVVEAQDYRDINITDVARVRTGEDLLWVRR